MNRFLGMITYTADLRYECRGQTFKAICIFDLHDFFHEKSKREILRSMTDGEIEDYLKSLHLGSFATVDGSQVFSNPDLISDEVEELLPKIVDSYDVDNPQCDFVCMDMSKLTASEVDTLVDFKMYDELLDVILKDEFKDVKMHTAEVLKDVSVECTVVKSYKDQSFTKGK